MRKKKKRLYHIHVVLEKKAKHKELDFKSKMLRGLRNHYKYLFYMTWYCKFRGWIPIEISSNDPLIVVRMREDKGLRKQKVRIRLLSTE